MKKYVSHFQILKNVAVAVMDFAALSTALVLSYWLWVTYPWHGNYQPFERYEALARALPFLGLLVFRLVGLYKPGMGVMGVEEQSLIFKAVWIIYVIGFSISFFYRDFRFSRLALMYSVFISIVFVSAERFFCRRFFEALNKKGIGVRSALVYGAGHQGQRLERWIRQSPKLGIQVMGYLDDDLERLIKKPVSPACLGGLSELESLAKAKAIELLFVAHRKLSEEQVIGVFQRCRELNIQCWAIPSMYKFHIERAELFNIGGIPLVGFREGYGRHSYVLIKRGLDILMALILLIPILPVMAVITLLMRWAAGPDVFFKQMRVGLNGKKFTMYKFRTLKSSPKGDDISPELKKNSQQMLPFGSFLRRSGLDELPQLWNVLKGDMSLIGPRPEMPFIVEKYGPLERERLSVKPGVTGLWQISEDRKRLLIHENMDYDLYYIERFSFNLDLAILTKTFFTILRRFFDVP